MESLNKYKKLSNSLISKINTIFSRVTFLTVDEIIKEEVELRPIWWELSKILDRNNTEYRKVSRELENLSEEDYDEWGYKIQDELDDLNYVIDWKVMGLQSLLDTLEKIVTTEEEDEILKHFKDIKPIEI